MAAPTNAARVRALLVLVAAHTACSSRRAVRGASGSRRSQTKGGAIRGGSPAERQGAWAHLQEREWGHKAGEKRVKCVRSPGGGRRRSERRSQAYDELRAYAEFHLGVLRAEMEEETRLQRVRLCGWADDRLARDGTAVFDLTATARDRLYGDTILRFDRRGEALPFHRFTAGDLVTISPSAPRAKIPAADAGMIFGRGGSSKAADSQAADSGSGEDAPGGGDGAHGDGLDGAVLSRSPKFIDVCVRARSPREAAMLRAVAEGTGAGGMGPRWRLDCGISSVPYERMALAVDTFCKPCTGGGKQADDPLREVLVTTFCNSEAEVPAIPPARVRLSRSVLARTAEAAGLDTTQRGAVRATFERRLTLVQGPPGTGKTRTACAVALATSLAAESPGPGDGISRGSTASGRSFLAAPSNVAADALLAGCLALGLRCVRLGRPVFVAQHLRDHALDALVPPPDPDEFRKGRQERGAPAGEEAWRAHIRRRWEVLAGAQVVVATTVGAGELLTGPMASLDHADRGVVRDVTFDLCLVDEASQCIEPGALVAMAAAGRPMRTVLVGDQCQLGPVLLSTQGRYMRTHPGDDNTDAPPASLFARLNGCGVDTELLSVQYRMPAALMAFSSHRFYEGRVRTMCEPWQRPRPRLSPATGMARAGYGQDARPPPGGGPGGQRAQGNSDCRGRGLAPLYWPHESLPLVFADTRGTRGPGTFHEARVAEELWATAEASAELLDLVAQAHGHPQGATAAMSVDGPGQAVAGVDEVRPQTSPPRHRAILAEDEAARLARVASSTSWSNTLEARVVAAAVRQLIAAGMSAADIGVITPYAAQVRCVLDELAAASPLGAAAGESSLRVSDVVEVKTVDGFQGREKEVIIVSAVRSNARRTVGFLRDWRRLNVSLTRARCGLIVVGDSRTLEADAHWRAFIDHARKRGCVLDVRFTAPGGADSGPLACVETPP